MSTVRGSRTVALAVGGTVVVVGLAFALASRGARTTEVANPAATSGAPSERIRVEVLNAGGVAGRARLATMTLRELGFDVVHFGNAASFGRDSSVVVDRVGRPDLSRAVANALGIRNVVSDPDANLFVDVTVLLGRSWSDRSPTGEGGRDEAEGSGWNPGRWLAR